MVSLGSAPNINLNFQTELVTPLSQDALDSVLIGGEYSCIHVSNRTRAITTYDLAASFLQNKVENTMIQRFKGR